MWPLGHGAGSLQAFPEEEDGGRVPGNRGACVQEGRLCSPGTFSWESLGLTLQLASCWPFCPRDAQDTLDLSPEWPHGQGQAEARLTRSRPFRLPQLLSSPLRPAPGRGCWPFGAKTAFQDSCHHSGNRIPECPWKHASMPPPRRLHRGLRADSARGLGVQLQQQRTCGSSSRPGQSKQQPTRVVASGSSSVLSFPPLSPTTQRPGPLGHLPWNGHQIVLRQENFLKLLFSRIETRARNKVEQQRQPRGSMDRSRASKALCAESVALCGSPAPRALALPPAHGDIRTRPELTGERAVFPFNSHFSRVRTRPGSLRPPLHSHQVQRLQPQGSPEGRAGGSGINQPQPAPPLTCLRLSLRVRVQRAHRLRFLARSLLSAHKPQNTAASPGNLQAGAGRVPVAGTRRTPGLGRGHRQAPQRLQGPVRPRMPCSAARAAGVGRWKQSQSPSRSCSSINEASPQMPSSPRGQQGGREAAHRKGTVRRR